MHPRNRYLNNPPDFQELAKRNDALAAFIKDDGGLDFKGKGAVAELTKSLLLQDFGITWSCKDGNLCPALTRSLNYLHWVEDLLFILGAKQEMTGIDIGCGASCIFPLLGCTMNPQWNFIGTDIEERSLDHARTLVGINGLNDLVSLLLTKKDMPIFATVKSKLSSSINNNQCFVMCNPPFFTSSSEAEVSQKKESSFGGLPNELWHEDKGEVEFIKSMIRESVQDPILQEKAILFTSMVGIKSHIALLISEAQSHESIRYISCSTLRQGHTNRWCLAWSFRPISFCRQNHLHNALTTGSKSKVSSTPKHKTLSFEEERLTPVEISARIRESIKEQSNGEARVSKELGLVAMPSKQDRTKLSFVCHLHVSGFALSISLIDEHNSDRLQFGNFCQRIEQDVKRVNRYWRRRSEKRKQPL